MSTTNCLLGTAFDRDESSKMTRVEYWYGIETSKAYTPSLTYALEGKITDVAQHSISWCYQRGGRRVEEAGETYYPDESGRRLGIMAMNSGPLDQPYSGARSKYCDSSFQYPQITTDGHSH